MIQLNSISTYNMINLVVLASSKHIYIFSNKIIIIFKKTNKIILLI